MDSNPQTEQHKEIEESNKKAMMQHFTKDLYPGLFNALEEQKDDGGEILIKPTSSTSSSLKSTTITTTANINNHIEARIPA